MPQYRIVGRRIASIPYAAGGAITIDLPRSYDYESIFLRLSGTSHVTVAAGAVRAEAPCQIVPRIEVIADGKNTLFSAPFWATSLGRYDRALIESGARACTPPSGFAIADYAYEAIGCIDFMTQDGLRAKDSNLRTRGFSMFQLRATFGQPGDIFTAGTVSHTGTPTLEVYTQELVELPDAKGQFSTPSSLRKVSQQRIATAASNTALDMMLPAGNYVKSVVLRTEGNTTAGEPSTAQLNSAKLQSGLDVRADMSGAQIRAKNNADYGQLTSGYYVLDVTSRGRAPSHLSDLWDLTGQPQP